MLSDIDYNEIKTMTSATLLEKIADELEEGFKPAVDRKRQKYMISDYNDAVDWGTATAINKIRGVIDRLNIKEDGDKVVFLYRGRAIRINRDKYMKFRPNTNDIDYILKHKDDGKINLEDEAAEPEEIAGRHTPEEIERILDYRLGEHIKMREIDDNLDEEEFYNECRYTYRHVLDGEACSEDFPVTDTPKKLGLLIRALDDEDDWRAIYQGEDGAIKQEDLPPLKSVKKMYKDEEGGNASGSPDGDNMGLIRELTRALEEVLEMQEQYSETLDALMEEVNILSGFIAEKNMGASLRNYRLMEKGMKKDEYFEVFEGLSESEARDMYVKLMEECGIDGDNADIETARRINKSYNCTVEMIKKEKVP